MKAVNATNYLKEERAFEENTYKWIYPLIEKCLNGRKVTDNLIEDHIDGRVDLSFELRDKENKENFAIKKIVEISEIKNMGFIEIDQNPLELKDGLNIFYGKNGSGKSTIYKSLVNTLGDDHVKSNPNIYNTDTNVSVKIKVIDFEDGDKTIHYTGKKSIQTGVIVYDTKKMDFLVEPKREQFEIPILKQEIFNHIRNLFEDYSRVINERFSKNKKRQFEIKSNFVEDYYLFSKNVDEIEKIINENKFTDEDNKKLNDKNKEIKKITTDSILLEKQILSTANTNIKDILNKYGIVKINEDNLDYQIIDINAELNKYEIELKEYKVLETLVTENSIDGFKDYIEKTWLINKKWKEFIISGLDFISTLEGNLDTCPYCHQKLSGEASALLKKYNSLKSDAAETMKTHDKSIENIRKKIKGFQNSIETCNEIINKIAKLEGYEINKEANMGVTEEDFENVLIRIDNKDNLIVAERVFVDKLNEKLNNLFLTYSTNQEKIKIKDVSIKSIEDDRKAIQSEIDELNDRKIIIEKKMILGEYIKLSKEISKYNSKLTDLRNLKTVLTKTQNQFSKESYIKLYEEQIKKEYEGLEQEQIIKPIYKPKKDDVYCSIESRKGSYNIIDVFSEGEIRIHSLAELFAEAELTGYKGVYIFDDPVNSLDESNIDYVAQRIKKLVESDNQVIIFTHNILFLNELIDVEKEQIINIEKLQIGENPNDVSVIIENQAFNEKAIKIRGIRIKNLMNEIETLKQEQNLVEMRNKIGAIYSEMSGYLEDYFEKKILGGIITRHRNNIRMGSVTSLVEINKDGQLETLNHLYEKTSKFCSRHSQALTQKKADYNDIKVDYSVFKEFVKLK